MATPHVRCELRLLRKEPNGHEEPMRVKVESQGRFKSAVSLQLLTHSLFHFHMTFSTDSCTIQSVDAVTFHGVPVKLEAPKEPSNCRSGSWGLPVGSLATVDKKRELMHFTANVVLVDTTGSSSSVCLAPVEIQAKIYTGSVGKQKTSHDLATISMAWDSITGAVMEGAQFRLL